MNKEDLINGVKNLHKHNLIEVVAILLAYEKYYDDYEAIGENCDELYDLAQEWYHNSYESSFLSEYLSESNI